MSDVTRRLVSHGGIYLLGNILQRAVSFIMLPIYTRYLTPADYGVLELISMVIDLVAILLGLRVSEAIFRFYHDYEDEKQRNTVITTAMILVSGVNLLGVLMIILFSNPLSLLIFDQSGNAHLLAIFSMTLFFQGLFAVPMVFLRARQKPMLFVAFSTLKLFLQLSLNIYFVIFQGMHVEGVIYSSVISGIIMSVVLSLYMLRITGISFSFVKAKSLVSFSFPLVMTGVISFFITFGDRYFLKYFGNLSEVGIYALAYKFGFLLMFLIVAPFASHWDSEKYVIMKNANAKQTYQDIFIAYSTIVIVFVVLVSIFVEDLLRIMSDKSFWPASRIVPVVLVAYVFNAWASYTNLGIFAKNKTVEITYGTLIGAIVAGVAYITLIPLYGAIGAAWATVLGFGSRFLWICWRSEKLYNMELSWGKVILLSFIGVIVYIASQFGPRDLIQSMFFKLLIVLCFFAFLLIVPILPEKLRKYILQTLRRPRKFENIIKEARKALPKKTG